MGHLFCFGLGYSATYFAEKLLQDGWRVSGTCRTSDKFPALKTIGVTPYIFDEFLPLENIWDLDSVTHVLHSIPPIYDNHPHPNPPPSMGRESEDVVIKHHLDDLKKLPNLRWVGYLSTTGVYGDHGGGWVDEETPTNPPNDRSKWRVEAENDWLASGLPVHVFRLSGIYGPGRSSFDALKNGTARRINKPGQVFSRIHVEDIAQILQNSINNPNPGSIYNCADDEPAAQADVVKYAAKLMGVQPPDLVDFDKADLSEMARSFYASNRRVSNKKIKDELGVELKYKDYKEGLDGLL